GRATHAAWQTRYDAWAAANPEGLALHHRLQKRELPAGWTEQLPVFEASQKGVATRKASGEVLSKLADVLPELWGGSADLAESNNTTMKGADSFLPEGNPLEGANPYGRTLHFGIREHAMGAVMNGIALHGGTRVYGGTFLVFSDYMRGAVRLAALMKLPVTYVWTHDSIGLGEDGPTHQPIEHLASLRAVPGLDVVRPADANETAVCWRTVLEHTDRPAGIALTRQNVPTFDRTVFESAEGAARGAYVLRDASDGQPKVLLVGTGSEVQICVAAQEQLEAAGIPTRVVSMPCVEWFREQDESYRHTVFPSDVRARVSVEAAVAQGWHEWVGDAGECVSLEDFGASAPYTVLYEQFGLTAERVVAAAQRSLSTLGATTNSN
ncbi:MAG: transketolase, partial [Frankiales bacterium]|nr:transketolase [Frankiales bacterium]